MKNHCPKNKNSGFTLISEAFLRIRTLTDVKNLDKVQPLNSGFTLMELLIVIVLIGVLSSFIITSSAGTAKKAHDSQRMSDLNQYRIALENFALKKNGLYPSRTTVQNATTVLGPDLGTTYLASYPADPTSDSSYYYRYQSNGSGNAIPDASQYILWAKLERGSSGSGGYWYVCANGIASEKATTPASSDCGF